MYTTPQLTLQQREVVDSDKRKCLVIAPAGSGKTEVLIRRIERILNESQGESFRLLAVTFTLKAADELKARLSRSVGEEVWRVDANTIHGFALDWLQRAGQAVGVSPDVVVYAEDRDRIDLLRRFLDSIGESHLGDQALMAILRRIDDLRTSLSKPTEAPRETFGRSLFPLSEIYEAYLAAMSDAGGIDFPGMLAKLLDLFEVDPAVLRRIQRTYRQILVDEGQDLTHAQAEVLRIVVAESLELCVVADDRQSINGWAGGSIKWAYKLVGSDYQRYELLHNFRCATQILSLARNVALHFNPPRTDAEPPWGTPKGMAIPIRAKDSDDEARIVADWIKCLVSEGIDPSALVHGEEARVLPQDIAVIARTRYGLDAIQQELTRRGHQVSVQVDAGSLLSSSEARLFHALLEVRANSRNVPAWRRVDDELFHLLGSAQKFDSEGRSLTELADAVSHRSIRKVVELINQSAPNSEGVEKVMGELAAGRYFAGPDLQKLLGWWNEYRAGTAHQDRDLSAFLRYLLRVQQSRPDQPGVRLTTAHRSKGLQFRAVAIVGLSQGVFPDYRALDNVDKVDAERRAFYVSITRASRALHLTWPRRRRTRYSERTDDPSQFLEEAGL